MPRSVVRFGGLVAGLFGLCAAATQVVSQPESLRRTGASMKLTIMFAAGLVGWALAAAVQMRTQSLTSNTPAPMPGPVASAVMIWNT